MFQILEQEVDIAYLINCFNSFVVHVCNARERPQEDQFMNFAILLFLQCVI